jgi:hypothetical protein
MTISLPPRRALPADVKERMRPVFTEARPHRTSTPLAVAAAVTLLVAGGFAVTQPGTREADPGRERVVAPSSRDVARCRTALNDQAWSSSGMVVFGLRKVLIGEDGRFCELTRSRAVVAPPDFQPTRLEAGSITYRSGQIIAGVPPLGARTARAREATPSQSRGSSEAVVTPDLFIVHTQSAMRANELVFDQRAVPIPQLEYISVRGDTENFESGDNDPAAPVNVLARCADNAFDNSILRAEDLDGWEPLMESGGLLLAHRGHREWAICVLNSHGTHSLSVIRTASDDPDATLLVGGYQTASEFFAAARTHRSARTAEVSVNGGPPVTANVVDGHFLTALSIAGGQVFSPANVHVVARNAANEVVYEGELG